jgi:hypothetical protein
MDALPTNSELFPGEPRSAARPHPKGFGPAGMPSASRQKTFIVENAGVLNRETKLAILSIVMMEIGPGVATETGSLGAKEVDIDLDAVTDKNEEVLGHIYNIVRARLESLNLPARAGQSPSSGDPGAEALGFASGGRRH